jgi:hypothetical protein
MANHTDLIYELEFEQQIQKMNDRELLEFLARKSYETSITCSAIRADVYGNGKLGLVTRMDRTERKQKDNRRLIISTIAVNGVVLSTLLTLVLTRIIS